MADQQVPARQGDSESASPFDELIGQASQSQSAPGASFTTAFRGYDKIEVDEAIAELSTRLRAQTNLMAAVEDRHRRAMETAGAQDREDADRLEDELKAASVKLAKAEQQIQALTEELVGATGESADRGRFEEVLRVAEDQASLLIKNATVQGDRLLEAARQEIQNQRKEAKAEVDAIIARAEHDAQQVRLRMETELTAHQARLEREAAHAAEKVSQAEQEAAAIRSEAERGSAALRSTVARETSLARAEAEEQVRELRVRALEFEESLTRRQDDAQQEFLMLHNQAVAHAERITQDANDQVAASLEHAQRVAGKADDFDKLMRAQAQQIEADAHVKASEHLERARDKAQRIIDTVTTHSQGVLRDAEDRTRQLRWQQHQLTSFMAEVRELIRPESALDLSDDEGDDGGEDVAGEAAEVAEASVEDGVVEAEAETPFVDSVPDFDATSYIDSADDSEVEDEDDEDADGEEQPEGIEIVEILVAEAESDDNEDANEDDESEAVDAHAGRKPVEQG